MEKKLVSVITPTYNHEDYIKQCIDSVLSQTHPCWEQIIIDDGSTDHTEDIVKEYDDKRISYIKQKNLGIQHLHKTYNKALELSKGDYIAVLEGDDYWPDYKLEKQIKAFRNPDVVLSCGNAEMVNDAGEFKGLLNKPQSIPQISPTNETLDRLLIKNYIPACTVLCEKRALLKVGGFQQPNNSPFVDYSTWLPLSRLGSFHYADGAMGYWRLHRGQVSSEKAFEVLKSHREYSIKFYNDLSEYEKELLTVNLQDIIESKNKDCREFYFLLGRKRLHEKNWLESRHYFKKSLKGSAQIRFYSLIGIICSYMKTDMERYISYMKRTHIDDLIE